MPGKLPRMPDEEHRYPNQRPVTVIISEEGIAERLAQLPTRQEIVDRLPEAFADAVAGPIEYR
jgi:hypothetical protein